MITIGSDNGLSPGRRQAIIGTNAGILLMRPLEINLGETSIEINQIWFVVRCAILRLPQPLINHHIGRTSHIPISRICILDYGFSKAHVESDNMCALQSFTPFLHSCHNPTLCRRGFRLTLYGFHLNTHILTSIKWLYVYLIISLCHKILPNGRIYIYNQGYHMIQWTGILWGLILLTWSKHNSYIGYNAVLQNIFWCLCQRMEIVTMNTAYTIIDPCLFSSILCL